MTSPAEFHQELAGLRAENARLVVENGNLAIRNKEFSVRIEELSAQVQWFQKQLFGQKSERRFPDVPAEQLSLGEPFQQTCEKQETPQTVAEHQRKKRRPPAFDDNGHALFFDKNTPVQEIKVANPEIAGLAPDEFEVIGQKTTHRLAQRPGAYVILKYVRDVIKIKSNDKDDDAISCPAAPESVFEKSHADVSFLAGLLIDKFLYHLPLYRQRQRLESSGVQVSRAWLTQMVHRCGDLLEPIAAAQLDSIRRSRVKLMDETPVKAGRKQKGKMRDAYFWPVMGGDDEIAFLYFPSREHRHVFDALGEKPDSDSVIVSDGYGAYRAFARATGTLNAQCWAHSRREFLKAEDVEPEKVKTALNLMRPLWEIEKDIKEKKLTGEARRLHRLEQSKPIVEKFFAWVEETLKDSALLPTNRLTKALSYVRTRRDALTIFLTDPDVPIDTNELERALRVIPMGRKNWLFCWTEVGAQYVGIFQSLLVTCKMHGVDPYTYLVDVLQRVSSHPQSEIDNLTPARWSQFFAANPLRSDLDSQA
ncbi:MAG: IS66 family transposase [Verrucomicrobiota bacterium]